MWLPSPNASFTLASAEAPQALEESRLFLQRRLTLFYGVLAAVNAFIILSSQPRALETGLPADNAHGLTSVYFFYSIVTGMISLLWLVCWRGRWSRRVLDGFDVGGTLASCVLLVLVFVRLPDTTSVFATTILSLTYVLIGRAVVIPSTGRRSLVLGLAASVVSGCGLSYTGMDIAASRSPQEAALVWFWIGAKPILISTLMAALASRVIYGLREQVREARRLGQYLLEEQIGQGGMGRVFRARHALLRRETAVKLLLPERLSPQALERFEREVQLTARLTHPHTVAIFDYGRTPDGTFYYAMEYLDGGDLDDLVAAAGPLPPGRVVRVLEQVCRALREAHGIGLIHRDIKPANILLCERGGESDVAKVVDFGLVKELSGGVGLSGTQDITGTPLYMAPEAISSPASVDARSDLYALGAVGYFLLTGETVFRGATMVEVCAHHLHSVPVPPSARTARPVPPQLEAVLLRCLEKEPAKRPASAEALREALLGCTDVEPWTDAEAARWWVELGPRLRAHREARRAREAGQLQPTLVPGATLTVARARAAAG